MPQTETDSVQLNVLVDREVDDAVEALAAQHGWSKRAAVEFMLREFNHVLDKLAEALENFDDDIVEVFRRVATEKPHGFIELTAGMKFGRVAGAPAVRLPNGWWIYPDAENELLAFEESTGHPARVVDGELKRIKVPTPEEVVLN